MLRYAHSDTARDSPCRMAGMEPTVESRGQLFSVAGSLSAGFGVRRMVAERLNSSQRQLDLGEKGVYSSYTLPINVRGTGNPTQVTGWGFLYLYMYGSIHGAVNSSIFYLSYVSTSLRRLLNLVSCDLYKLCGSVT